MHSICQTIEVFIHSKFIYLLLTPYGPLFLSISLPLLRISPLLPNFVKTATLFVQPILKYPPFVQRSGARKNCSHNRNVLITRGSYNRAGIHFPTKYNFWTWGQVSSSPHPCKWVYKAGPRIAFGIDAITLGKRERTHVLSQSSKHNS